jgi:hypothetical protein
VPLSTNAAQDPFSGQFLRLEEYIGSQEDPHLPDSLPKTDIKGIAISATGYFLLSAKRIYETYGKALTETVTNGNHTVTIEKGDWTLVASNGKIEIETANKGAPGTIKLKSTDSDIVFKALNGKSGKSDRFDVSVSKSNTVTFIAGYEFSKVTGQLKKDNTGFLMKMNLMGEFNFKVMDNKAEAITFKYGYTSFSLQIGSLKCQVINFKLGMTDAKKMVLYNKIIWTQISLKIAEEKQALINNDTSLTDMKMKIAAAEKIAAKCSFQQLIRM